MSLTLLPPTTISFTKPTAHCPCPPNPSPKHPRNPRQLMQMGAADVACKWFIRACHVDGDFQDNQRPWRQTPQQDDDDDTITTTDTHRPRTMPMRHINPAQVSKHTWAPLWFSDMETRCHIADSGVATKRWMTTSGCHSSLFILGHWWAPPFPPSSWPTCLQITPNKQNPRMMTITNNNPAPWRMTHHNKHGMAMRPGHATTSQWPHAKTSQQRHAMPTCGHTWTQQGWGTTYSRCSVSSE